MEDESEVVYRGDFKCIKEKWEVDVNVGCI